MSSTRPASRQHPRFAIAPRYCTSRQVNRAPVNNYAFGVVKLVDMRSVARLASSIIITQAAGALGALATAPAIPGWYRGLEKPGFNPPAWVFGPAWTLLYLLMGIALFLVWQKPRSRGKNAAIAAFGVQLVLNIAWSYIFFGLKSPGLAFAEIIVLWAAVLLTLILFRRVSRPAGILLIPYIIWVTFAAALNYAIWTLN